MSIGVLIEPAPLSPSPQTAVVCDSTTYLPSELIEAHGIEVISLYVTLDGEQRRETEIADLPAFYGELRASESRASSSAKRRSPTSRSSTSGCGSPMRR